MKQKLYLIAYDIADHKRLGRIARYLCQRACRIQYSVFAAVLSRSGLNTLLAELEAIIDDREDDVRIYPLPAVGDVTLLGQQFFATETLLVHNGYCRLEMLKASSDDDIEQLSPMLD